MSRATPVSAVRPALRDLSIPRTCAPAGGRGRSSSAVFTFPHNNPARVAMEFVAGFLIALAIAVTGVGGGVITAPVLMLFFGMAPAQSVGTSLLFAALVKLLVVPVYLYRRLVNRRVLALMLLGGLPGVLAGGLYLKHLHSTGKDGLLYLVLGGTIAATAAFNLYRSWSK